MMPSVVKKAIVLIGLFIALICLLVGRIAVLWRSGADDTCRLHPSAGSG